ncbi:MAG: sulfatase-like hydrolase/transferase, partial [Nitrospirae bacterium]|nr:sulfatase-like hydrolase/transferase [Nitrospirota bacterium]
MRWLRSPTIHPVLIGVYPVLALLAFNLEQAEISDAVRSLAAALVGSLLLLLLLRLVVGEWHRAAAISTLALVLFYSYGHIYGYLKGVQISEFVVGRHRYLAPIWLLAFAAGTWAILRKLRRPRALSSFLNTVTLIAILFTVVQIGAFEYRRLAAEREVSTAATNLSIAAGLKTKPDQPLRDIYYIILDGYARADTLREDFELDNSDFLNRMQEMGFYVAECSQSNYAQTELSLASSLNYSYLQDLDESFVADIEDRSHLRPLIVNSAVRAQLEALGYQTVAFETGYYWTQLKDADVYLFPRLGSLQNLGVQSGINGFETLLFRTTAGTILADGASVLPKALVPDLNSTRRKHRDRVLFVLSSLERLSSLSGPKFVFVHIVSPHVPFVFGPEGETVNTGNVQTAQSDDNSSRARYRDQVIYLNSRMEQILEHIIDASSPDPIIILQGDHGTSAGGHRMRILNAYYLPEGGEEMLYKLISPVNSFRVVFNRYFGGRY